MMSARLIAVVVMLAVGAAFFNGCGPGRDAIYVTASDNMEFIPWEFAVEPGAAVTVVLQHSGEDTPDAVENNLVILQANVDAGSFIRDSSGYPENDYIDPAREEEVIAATSPLGPGVEEILRFVAPGTAGEYPFVCTASGTEGMRGIMVVGIVEADPI